MDKTDAVFYTQKLPHGYNCHMPVIDYMNTSVAKGSGAIIVIDMDDTKGQDKYNNKFQIDYMSEVFDKLKGTGILTINCAIKAAEKQRSQRFVTTQTVLFTRGGSGMNPTGGGSGSVLNGSTAVGNLRNGQDLKEVIKDKDPIIVMGWDARMCVLASIFGIHINIPQKNEPPVTRDDNGLLDIGKCVITSRVLLVKLSEPLPKDYGILNGQ